MRMRGCGAIFVLASGTRVVALAMEVVVDGGYASFGGFPMAIPVNIGGAEDDREGSNSMV